MKNLFSWLLRLIVLIVLAAIAWVIYVNFQQQSGQQAEERATSAEQQLTEEITESATPVDEVPQTSPSEEQPSTTETPATVEQQAAQPTVTAEPATPSVTVQLPTTEPATEAKTPPAVTAETEQPSAPEQSVPASAATETAPSAKVETAQPAATASPAQAGAKPATEQPASLQQARMAAWKGQWDKAESVYRELQQGNPEDYNIHGELGNLYYMQRKGKEAAEAYYQAATLLAAQGYRRDAMRLMQVIQRLDPGLGTKLQQELFPGNGGTAATSPGPQSAPAGTP